MRSIMYRIGLIGLCVALSGCWNGVRFPLLVDEWLFREMGGTLFSNPEHLSLKEIHLDNGTLVGRQVVVEGTVDEVNSLGTYLVMSDQSARLLVVLTDVVHISEVLPKKAEFLQVLGTIESGKKGLPYVKAIALRSGIGAGGAGTGSGKGMGST